MRKSSGLSQIEFANHEIVIECSGDDVVGVGSLPSANFSCVVHRVAGVGVTPNACFFCYLTRLVVMLSYLTLDNTTSYNHESASQVTT